MQGFDRESYFLTLLEKEGITRGVGDDCCILDIHPLPSYLLPHKAHIHKSHTHTQTIKSLVVGMDSFCEEVHFLRDWFSPYELATKAFLVNYSDIIAMNATPLYAALSVALPKDWGRAEIKAFVRGIGDFCRKYHIWLIGGDTISAAKMQIHITLFGKAHKHTLYRDRIKPKSILCYTNDRYPQNTITQCYKVLKNLLNLPNGRIAKAKGRFLSPHIRAPFIRECAPFLKGGMDISDGILAEITRICAINHLFFKPCMPFFAPYLKPLLQSGESYEMLIAIDSKDFLRLKRKAARHRIKVCKLGTFTRQRQILPSFKHWH
ncbi:thiamine-phosphate kinase [Helicobacter mastomyrinus]|uniref:Thiamine-phosphate kinase n=3 Tax=Helicobacter TaxID=209 RepID=A0ABZ3F7U6_9HELI|nr:thiamine-phosphate kinase [uncultured Helicobacter sp.]